MQAGACTTALDGARDYFVMPKQAAFEQETMPKKAARLEGENTVDFSAKDTAFENEVMPKKAYSEQETMPKKAARKRTKGTGDTETTGKHNKRFMAYSKAVKEGKLNPSRYALTRFDIDGKKIGSVTAVEFLLAMEKAGVVQRTEKGGKTAWAKCT
jgi:hypothetical protein